MSTDTTLIAGLACRAALLESRASGLEIRCDLGFAGGRLSRWAGRPWSRGADLALLRDNGFTRHTPEMNPGGRSFDALMVDPRCGIRRSARPAHPRERGAGHLVEFRGEADEVPAALAAFQIDQDDVRTGPDARV
jgi:hypothetical protein